MVHPIINNAPIGIRFEVGGNQNVYLDNYDIDEYVVNPEYVWASLCRAKTIYESVPQSPNILRIDGYPDEENSVKDIIELICEATGISQPHEQVMGTFQWNEDDEVISQLQLYWDLNTISFSVENLLREIIIADIGGCSALVSNVYFVNTENAILFHLYDDRGADLVVADKELLRPMFEQFQSWILDYDREKIYRLFVK